ncbi:MAG TPA: ABC transporter substrate-binding protein [Burkholderiales bacterium]|nr:ABC transporter substrate-binding protein [Burkholderiales bacterium]
MAKQLLIGLVVVFCAVAVPTAAQNMTPPDALARSVTDEVLAVLRADTDIQAGNRKKVVDLVETKVLPHFNFVRMTQLAVGRHWREASPEQRKLLVNEFRTLLVQTYAATLTAYRDQTIVYRPLRIQPEDTDVVVRSLINQPGGKPVTVDYRMQKSDNGWKVYDVVVGDLSLVQSYRGSFNTEVQKGGIDGLVKALTEKNKQLVSRQ